MEKGKISCVMSSYNTKEEYLKESINSILNQTYSNIEIIIVDDGSDISVASKIKDICDDRIILLKNDVNCGVAYSKNKALEVASGEYVAIMDDDDISDKRRFEKEMKYLLEHPKCQLVSSQMAFISNDGRKNPWLNIPEQPDKLLSKLFWDNSKPFPHGPTMIKRSFLEQYKIKYDERYKKACDYRLWVDCARNGAIFHVINEYLYFYRVHSGQISQSKRNEQIYYANKICLDQLEYLGIYPTDDEKNIHLLLRDSEGDGVPDHSFRWKEKIIDANKKYGYCQHNIFKKEVNYRFFKLCFKEYIIRKNNKYKKYFFKSLNLNNIFRSATTVIVSKIYNKNSKTLKV